MSKLRDDVLSSIDIVDLVERYVKLKKVGKNRVGLCPFHKENTPSFTVAEDKQIFKCFGCGKGGNAITFHMEIEKTDFLDTLQLLARDANIDVSKYKFNPDEYDKKQSAREKLKLINKHTQSRFSKQLAGSAALTYLKEDRKLSDKTIKDFGLGFAPDSHYDLVKFLESKGFSSSDIIEAGLAKKGNSGETYAFFRNRVTFPIRDHIGNIVGFGARALDKDQQPKYLNTTETALYDKSKLLYGLDIAKQHQRDHDLLVVVEGYMDVIALAQYGLPIGVAPCGTAITGQQLKLIKRHNEKVAFAFDQDSAGFEATIRALKVAYKQDTYPQVVILPPDYKDIDERLVATQTELTTDSLLKQSKDGFSFVLEQLAKRYDLGNPVEIKKFVKTGAELANNVADSTIYNHFLQQMSDILHIPVDSVEKQAQQIAKKQVGAKDHGPDLSKVTRKSPSTQLLLGALLYQDYLGSNNLNDERVSGYVNLLEELSTHFPGSLTHQVLSQEINDETAQQLIQAQLWREEMELKNLPEHKQRQQIAAFLDKQLHLIQKSIFKSKELSSTEKQSLLEQIKSVKKQK